MNIGKAKNHIYSKFFVPFIEKTYKSSTGDDIHYVYYPSKGDMLLICFQAYNAGGPRYNYIASLSEVKDKYHRLYIKDDFIESGDYYLGRDGKYNIESSVNELIQKFIEKTGAKKLVFVGSSKGGYAAINFGLMYPSSVMIVAAPQYKLGAYMTDATKFHGALKDILGENYTEDDVRTLDDRLRKKIEEIPSNGQKLYIHCSLNDKTYERHVKNLIEDMKETGREVDFDWATYEEHGELRYFFPKYMITSLLEVSNA